MFVLSELLKTLRIPPEQFGKQLHDAIVHELEKSLIGKVINGVGLCIALYDIREVSDSFILPGDGAAHTKVKFRLVVFKPFVEEVLMGKIKSCSEEGVRVTLGFFDDIIITPDALQLPCRYDQSETVWIWEYESDNGKHDLYMDPGEPIRFRVIGRKFFETSPPQHKKSEEPKDSDSQSTVKERIPPFVVLGSISEAGLGLTSWWS